MAFDGVAQRLTSRRSIDRLKLGTAIGGAAVMLLVPAMSRAASVPTSYALAAPTLAMISLPGESPVRRSVHAVAPTLPQDLTIRTHVARLAVTPLAAGDVYVHDGDVSKSGDHMPGIATTSTGSTTIVAGGVTTSGDYSDGITATGTGPISISVGSVATAGIQSTGISAISDGDISIKAGSISTNATETSGVFAYGVYARSNFGTVNVDVGDISTHGAGSHGISAYGHDVNITAGSVSTLGNGAAGITGYGTGAGAAVDIMVNGPVSTYGVFATGIGAFSDGSISIQANGAVSTDATGFFGNARGIVASAQDDVTIGATDVTTVGPGSIGIVAASVSGDIAITADDVTTHGEASGGISASTVGVVYDPSSASYVLSAGGKVTINVGNVSTKGAYSTGISAAGSSTEITISGAVTTSGNSAYGVVAAAYAGDAVVHNKGTITTHYAPYNGGSAGVASTGIYAKAAGNVVIDGGGSISALGTGSKGIVAVSYEGGISIEQGNIASADAGIYAVAVVGQSDIGKASNGISISVGNVSTTSTGATAAGIVAINNNYQGDVSVSAGNVATLGDSAFGIYANSRNGQTTIDAGDVSTRGLGAHGIVARGQSIDVTAGSVETVDNGAFGILAYGAPVADPSHTGVITVSAGSVSTQGLGAYGILAGSQSGADTHVSVENLSTAGDHAAGIYATTTNRYGNTAGTGSISISAGNVLTTGASSTGIFAHAWQGVYDGDITITAGTVETDGKYSNGIYAISNAPGDISIKAGTVTTKGDDAYGIVAATEGGKVDVTADNVVTTGLNGRGIIAASAYGTTVTAGNVSTQGDYSIGIGAYSVAGDVAVTTTGSVSTKGLHAYGVFASGNTGKVVSVANNGAITTAGEQAHGIYAVGSIAKSVAVTNGGSVSVKGNDADAILVKNVGSLSVTNSGSISAGGTNGIGIGGVSFDDVATPIDLTIASTGKVATSGSNAIGILAEIIGNPYNLQRGTETVSVTAGSVATSGAASTGIFAKNGYGAIAIDASNVTASGDGSTGIAALGGGDVSIKAGTVSSTGTAIYTTAKGVLTLDITGKVASQGGDGIFAKNSGGATTIAIGADGSVIGAGDGIAVAGGAGTVSITNAGTIAGGAGYAIDISGDAPGAAAKVLATVPAATVANSGTIAGAVKLADGDDVLTNSGLFVATKDSDFGGGNDLFVNSGVVSVQPGTKPGSVTMLGLEQFQNKGVVDLRNGVAGDTLTLPGSYVGSGGARLGLDVGANGIADKLVVTGAATGSTTIVLDATAANATLLAKPVTLVQAGEGTSATAFGIANQNVGFVTYGLRYDAVSGSFQLSSTAGAAVHRLAKANEAAQAIWHQSADAWSAHMASLRDADEPAGRVWGQAYGKVDTRHDRDGSYALGYRQDYYGGQAGIDLGGKRSEDGNGLIFGVTGGYLSSHLTLRAGPERLRFDTLDAGAYASLRAGPLFVNLLGQYDHYHTNAGDSVDRWTDTANGKAYGAQAEIGARLGRDAFFAEPIATLAWQRTDLGTLRALGQSLRFDHDTGLTGTAGARVGGTFDLKGGAKAIFYAKAAYVHEFKGKGGLLFESGGTSEDVGGKRLGDYGQGAIGVNILTAGRMSGFIEGDADVGGDTRGGGGRVGISFKL